MDLNGLSGADGVCTSAGRPLELRSDRLAQGGSFARSICMDERAARRMV